MKIVAPRGTIVDRHGEVIVENRAGVAVGIRPMDVPEGELDQELETLVAHPQDEAGRAPQRIMDYLSEHSAAERRRFVDSFLTWRRCGSGTSPAST